MKNPGKTLLISALASLTLFLIFTWPLGSFWKEAIPSSSQNIEHPAMRQDIPGDHLQLMYHFDLVGKMFSGEIPFFHNVYEFNTGDDAETYKPGSYFFPMSGVYALLKPLTGAAAAWNTVLWLSFWISALGCWAWLGGFTPARAARLAGCALFLLLPFRWASLLGGSPAGIALMYVPWLAWMIDRAIVRPTWLKGGGVGFILLLLYWADLQMFYFSALSVPLLALLSLGWHGRKLQAVWKSWPKLLPGGIAFLGMIAAFYLWRKANRPPSLMQDGRSWHEMSLFSPRPPDLLFPGAGISETVFISLFGLSWLILALMMFVAPRLKQPRKSALRLGVYFMMLCASLLGIALALGAFGPAEGKAIALARAHIPMYDMIRQSSKIFGVVPLWLAWLLTLGLASPLPSAFRKTRLQTLLPLLAALTLSISFVRNVHPTLCLLPASQPAYRAIQKHAYAIGEDQPRVLAVPLWPGDSADTSVPMHYAQQYGLRLVNGYSPVVSKPYKEEVFDALASVNQGLLTESQLSQLQEMGVGYLVVHANMFPEKVSPFPIRETLSALDRNPGLKLMLQDGPVHVYHLEKKPAAPENRWTAEAPLLFPARRFEFEHLGGERIADPSASHGHFARLNAESESVLRHRPMRVTMDRELTLWLRIRGQGELKTDLHKGEKLFSATKSTLDFENWVWIQIPLPAAPQEYAALQFSWTASKGELDLDSAFLSGDGNLLDLPANGRRLPASWFFHAGYADPATEAVHFEAHRDPDRVVFYGPLLPLSAGNYLFRFDVESPAPAGTSLGEFHLGYNGEPAQHRMKINASDRYVPLIEWEVTEEKPLRIEFHYSRKAPVTLKAIEIQPRP